MMTTEPQLKHCFECGNDKTYKQRGYEWWGHDKEGHIICSYCHCKAYRKTHRTSKHTRIPKRIIEAEPEEGPLIRQAKSKSDGNNHPHNWISVPNQWVGKLIKCSTIISGEVIECTPTYVHSTGHVTLPAIWTDQMITCTLVKRNRNVW